MAAVAPRSFQEEADSIGLHGTFKTYEEGADATAPFKSALYIATVSVDAAKGIGGNVCGSSRSGGDNRRLD